MAEIGPNRLHRVTELFVTGRELLLGQGPDGPVLVWVNKLNAFQRNDAQRDGAAGQSRRALGLGEDSENIKLLRARIPTYTSESLIGAVLAPRASEFYLAGRDDVHADEAWTERLVLIERGDALAADGSHQTQEEAAQLAELNLAYLGAVEEASEVRRADAAKDLEGEERGALEALYVEAYKRMLTFEAFQDEYNRTEIFYALRDCQGVATPEGHDHTRCTHQRLLPSRAGVAELPEELLERVQNTINLLNMPPASAGNSVAPPTSSGSSEPPNSAGDSPPSTPEATSPPPAGTSSTP